MLHLHRFHDAQFITGRHCIPRPHQNRNHASGHWRSNNPVVQTGGSPGNSGRSEGAPARPWPASFRLAGRPLDLHLEGLAVNNDFNGGGGQASNFYGMPLLAYLDAERDYRQPPWDMALDRNCSRRPEARHWLGRGSRCGTLSWTSEPKARANATPMAAAFSRSSPAWS